jgi:hypothetical protein
MYGFVGLFKIILQSLQNRLGYTDQPNLTNGTANTALVYHNKIYALVENNLPYLFNNARFEINVDQSGKLKEVGHHDYDKKLKH